MAVMAGSNHSQLTGPGTPTPAVLPRAHDTLPGAHPVLAGGHHGAALLLQPVRQAALVCVTLTGDTRNSTRSQAGEGSREDGRKDSREGDVLRTRGGLGRGGQQGEEGRRRGGREGRGTGQGKSSPPPCRGEGPGHGESLLHQGNCERHGREVELSGQGPPSLPTLTTSPGDRETGPSSGHRPGTLWTQPSALPPAKQQTQGMVLLRHSCSLWALCVGVCTHV